MKKIIIGWVLLQTFFGGLLVASDRPAVFGGRADLFNYQRGAVELFFQEPAEHLSLDEAQRTALRLYFQQFRVHPAQVEFFVNEVDHLFQGQGGHLSVLQAFVLLRYFGCNSMPIAHRAFRIAVEGEMHEVTALFTALFEGLGFSSSFAEGHGRVLHAILGDACIDLRKVFFVHLYGVLGLSRSQLDQAYQMQEASIASGHFVSVWEALAYQFYRACMIPHESAVWAARSVTLNLDGGASFVESATHAFLTVNGLPTQTHFLPMRNIVGDLLNQQVVGFRAALFQGLYQLLGLNPMLAELAGNVFVNTRRSEDESPYLKTLMEVFYVHLGLSPFLADWAAGEFARRVQGLHGLSDVHWGELLIALNIPDSQIQRGVDLLSEVEGLGPWYAFARVFFILKGLTDIDQAMAQLAFYEAHCDVVHPLEAMMCAFFNQSYRVNDVSKLLKMAQGYLRYQNALTVRR